MSLCSRKDSAPLREAVAEWGHFETRRSCCSLTQR